jgi:type I restriction enzyme S subunit
LDEQEEIASALSTTQQKISVATNKKSQLQDLFRTLLNELMTAKIRVHELDFSTGEHPA